MIMRYLTLDDIKIAKPDFENSNMPKGQIITNWLIEWVKHSLECGIADFGDIIPKKEELAKFLNVSPATIQNSIRSVKNLGFFVSKQSIGTSINDINNNDIKNIDELKRGGLIQTKIKRIILSENISLNCQIPSIKELSDRTEISKNTIRFVLNDFERLGYLQKKKLKGNKHIWIYIKEFLLTQEEKTIEIEDDDYTLTKQLVIKIKNYIEKTYKQGEKILPNQAFSNMFDVSIKTVNDAMKILNNKKIILSRRGRYGTIYLGQNEKKEFISLERKKAPLNKYGYYWQKALHHLKKHIVENYKAGDKIESIRKLASLLNVSPNTIRRALENLTQDGYLISKRGKTGGIFIVELPQFDKETYRWLALNIDAIKN